MEKLTFSFKVIVAGSRTFNDYPYLKQALDNYLREILADITIVCGCSMGADRLGW